MRWANFFHIYQPPHWPRAIIQKVARESYRPLIQFLLAHEHIRITLNISGSLTEQLTAGSQHQDIIKGIRTLLRRGQIEVVDSAMYHAILPLLPEHEIVRQVRLNHSTNRRAFGALYHPRGFFPPEMAYGPRLGTILSRLGYSWIVLDGISHPGYVDYTRKYTIKNTNLTAVFRNRYISDYLAFEIKLSQTNRFLDTVQRWNNQRDVLITAMDGENLGHHRHAAKRVWQRLVHEPHVETVTISELLQLLPGPDRVSVRSASWSSTSADMKMGVPFALWKHPKNSLHRLQWELFGTVFALVQERRKKGSLPSSLQKQFDQTSSSDWFWWASREPWWDIDIVVAAAQRLRLLGDQLNDNPNIAERMRALVDRITDTAERWNRLGIAQRHAVRFLKKENSPRYLGGKSVTYRHDL
ncbi:MAG: hypothetical protein V1907_04945 [Candidatus Kerfeldbacteria bacterium]